MSSILKVKMKEADGPYWEQLESLISEIKAAVVRTTASQQRAAELLASLSNREPSAT